MINKNIDDITIEVLQSLITNRVVESKTIEYKQSLPKNNSDTDKKEFLADVSSFANSSGGDLIYGIPEKQGIPKALDGITTDNIDQETLRLENMMRDGIEPRITGINIKSIELTNSKYILIIRIPNSWISPHRVIFKGHDKFYSRNNSGKYPLDVAELRVAFNLSETIAERIRRFREDRIAKIFADEMPIPFFKYGKVILHLLPIASFNPAQSYEIAKIAAEPLIMKPIHDGNYFDYRYNFDGFITYFENTEGTAYSYVQLHKNGIIEAVEGFLLEKPKIPSALFEVELMKALPQYLIVLKILNVELPFFVLLTLLGTKGRFMSIDDDKKLFFYRDKIHPIDRDVLYLPEILIDSYDVEPKVVLKPCFDAIWNACGFPRSMNYDKNGN